MTQADQPSSDGAETPQTPDSGGDTNVDTGGGDAVINEAPDGGGVDNNGGGDAGGDGSASE